MDVADAIGTIAEIISWIGLGVGLFLLPETASAILDRFLHHAQVIAITGKSYRLKNASIAKTKPSSSQPENDL